MQTLREGGHLHLRFPAALTSHVPEDVEVLGGLGFGV